MFHRGIGSLALASFLVLAGVAPGQGDKKEPAPFTAKQLDAVWADFGQNDEEGTEKALEGVRAMIGAPKLVVPFLKERLKPVPGPDAKRIQQCIDDLDGNDFKTREKAAKDLEAIGSLAAPALEKKLQEKLPLDLQRRVEGLLEKADRQNLSVDDLRTLRGIEVLRGIGGPEAAEVLEKLAKGADGSVLTLQARNALASVTAKPAGK